MRILLLILLCLVAYANAWPDVLVFDDKELLANARLSSLALADIARFFGEGLWVASGSNAGMYRPLFLAWMTIESKLFGDWYAGHHLVNILFHAATTVLLYKLCEQLLKRFQLNGDSAAWAAFLASAVFAVHPVHAEVVNSIFNGSELFVSILVLGGLAWFFKARPQNPWLAWAGLNAIYLVALLFRESASSYPGLVVLLLFLVSTEPWLKRIRQCWPVFTMLLPLGIYFYLRSTALADESLTLTAGPSSVGSDAATGVGLAEAGLQINLTGAREVLFLWYESLKLLLWPHPLQIYYSPARDHLWLAAALQLVLIVFAAWRYLSQQRPGLLVGLAFFYTAILPSSRLIARAGESAGLADRLLYLPSVGLSIALAFWLAYVLRGEESSSSKQRVRKMAVGSVVAACLVLTPLTWARNADWSDELRLFETDYARMENPKNILYTLIGAHLETGNMNRVIELCREHRNIVMGYGYIALRCGDALSVSGKLEQAERMFLAFANPETPSRTTSWVNFRLGQLYVQMGRRSEADDRFHRAVAIERFEFLREYMEAVRLLLLYPHDPEHRDEARQHLERSLELQPRFSNARETLEKLP